MPKLTLRDLFSLVTIVALPVGWAVDHWRQRAWRSQHVEKANRQLNQIRQDIHIIYDKKNDSILVYRIPPVDG